MMITLKHIIKGYIQPTALVLMYHRVTASAQDVWNITVHPALFEVHLKVLKDEYHVLPLHELLDRQKRNSLPRNSLAITFDDGYQDNFLVAKPLLEKYSLPATFFIATANTDTENQFWWDELEEFILRSPQLPTHFQMELAGVSIDIDLGEESVLTDSLREKLGHWKAFVQEPDTQRGKLFLHLWQTLRPLSHTMQQHSISKIKEWAAGRNDQVRLTCMSSTQLQALANHQLFSLGAHTCTHPLLSSLSKESQHAELQENRCVLQDMTSQPIETCSFPYGAYNADSMAVAQEIGFTSAFTTQAQGITRQSNPFQLGRIQVPNLHKHDFQQLLRHASHP